MADEGNRNRFAQMLDEEKLTQDRLVGDVNRQLSDLITRYRSGNQGVTEKDLLPFFPGYTEYDIAQMYGTTTEASNPRMSEKTQPFTPEMIPGLQRRGEATQSDFDRMVREGRLLDPMMPKRVMTLADGGDVSNDQFIQQMMVGTMPTNQGPSPVDTAVSDFISSRSKLVTDPQEFFRVMGENLETYHGKPLRENPEKYLMEQLGPGALAGTIKKAGGQFIPYYGTKTPEDIAKDFTSGGAPSGSIADQLDKWIMSRLPRYIKNQMGTENDSLVKMVDDQTEKAIKQLDAYDRRILKLQNEIKAREAEKGPGSARASQERLMDEIEARQEFLENTGNFLLPNNRLFGVSGEQENVLAAHESGFLRAPAATPSQSGSIAAKLKKSREKQGFPAEGTARTRPGRTVEEIIDESLRPTTLRELFYKPTASPEDLKKAFERDFRTEKIKLPDNLKLDPDEVFYGLDDRYLMDVIGGPASHMLDELHNAMRPASGLPPSLQITPENLNQFDFERAMRHVSKIDEWRMQQSRGADLEGGMKSAAVYKEYPDSPRELRWVRLKADESLPKDEARKQLQEALDREGNIMGHCVGAYCDPVLEGRTEIYSLRDSRGKSHVTIEVDNNKSTSIGTFLDEVPGQAEKYGFTKSDSRYGHIWTYPRKKGTLGPWDVDVIDQPTADEIDKTILNSPEFKQWLDSQQKQIRQIKGKGNDKQKDAYTPYVQDFVRTGNWDINNIGDFENTDLVRRGGKLYTKEEEAAEMARVEPLIAEAKEFIYKDPVFDFIRKANKKRFDMSVNNPRFRRLEDIERFDLTPDGYTLSNIEAMLDDPMAYVDRGQTVLDVYQRVLAKVDEIKSNLPSIQKAAETYGPEVDRYAAGGEVTNFIKRFSKGGEAEDDSWKDEIINQMNEKYSGRGPFDERFAEEMLRQRMGKEIKGLTPPPEAKVMFPDYKVVEDLKEFDNAQVFHKKPETVFADPIFLRSNPLVLSHEFEHQMDSSGRRRYANAGDPRDLKTPKEDLVLPGKPEYYQEPAGKLKTSEIVKKEGGGPEYFMEQNLMARGMGYKEARDYLDAFKEQLGSQRVRDYILKKYPDLEFYRLGSPKENLNEYLADFSGIETFKGVDLTKDSFIRRNVFGGDDDLIADYKAVTGLRQDRLDAKDLAPYVPDYNQSMTAKVKRFIQEKLR